MTTTLILFLGGLGIVMLIASLVLNRQARPAAEERPVNMAAMRAHVKAAVERDDLVEAVRIYRRETGARLLEASDAVQRIALDRR